MGKSLVTVGAKQTLAQLMDDFVDEHGEGIGGMASKYVDCDRLPTAWLPVDVALGGGFPRNKITEVFGKEGSGKSNLVQRVIAINQHLHPEEKCVYVDIEQGFSAPWFKKLGGDPDKLLVLRPLYAEQAGDMICDILFDAMDVGVIALDSIAAMEGTAQIDNSLEKKFMGGTSIIVNAIMRKILVALGKAAAEGRKPTILAINHLAQTMSPYGDPETTPGGRFLKFAATCRLRVYGKKEMDTTISKAKPAYMHTTALLRKMRAPHSRVEFSYDLALMDMPDMKTGEVDWRPEIKGSLERMGLWQQAEKKSQGWMIYGSLWPTQTAFFEAMTSDVAMFREVSEKCVHYVLGKDGKEDYDPAMGKSGKALTKK